MMRDLSDQVHQLRLHFRRLLPKIYSLVSGLSPTKHKAAVKFIHAHPELVAKLTRRFPEHPTSITWDKADKFARETLYRCAHSVVESLDSVYYLLEDMVIFQDQALRLFGDVNQRLSQAKARDRSNEILGYWMDLLCDMISLHFLGCRTPQKAALQVYLAAHFILHGADPPHSSQIVNFVVTFSSNPMASLQAEFSQYGPRLRQVVGNVVWPVLSQITSMLEASKLGLFRIGTSDACEGLRLDSLMNANHLNLASVPDYKKWVLCACLICPGILMHLDVRTALSNILSSCTKMQIFNDQCVSVHELFDQTVKPALEHIYKSESKGMKDRDKKADIKASIRELVGVSRSIWDKGGWEIKKADRLVLIHECRKIYAWAEENPANMAGSVLRLLGLLSITRDEILWYFNEVGGSTKVPEAPTMSLGVQPMPKLDGKELDPLVVSLIDIHVKLQMLMLRYRTLITTSIVQDIKDQLVAHILPDVEQNLAAIRSHGESFFLVANRLARLVSIMQTLPNKLAKVANGFWKWNTYSEFGEVWRSILFLLIEKQNHPIWAWSAEGGDGYDWMNKVNKVALQCGVIGSYVDTVAHYSSLHVLCFYRSQIQCLLRQCMGTLIPEGVNPMSLLHVFSQFLRNDIDSPDPFQPRSPNQFNQFAEQSCKDLVHMFMEKIKQLIVNCLRTVGQDATSAYNVVSSMDIMSSSESELFQSTAEQGSFDVHWRRLCSLVATFSDVGEVQVTERFKFNPEVYLSDAISSTYRASLTRQVFKGALLQPPSKLEEEHRKFMTLCKILQSYTKFDIVSPLHSVRRSLVGTPVANPSGPLLMPSIADWYTGYFIRDTRNLGILFSPGNRSFVALNINEETASAVSCGRLSELRCLVMVIGTEGVQQLELHWRAEVTSAASLLLEALKAQKSLLEKLSR